MRSTPDEPMRARRGLRSQMKNPCGASVSRTKIEANGRHGCMRKVEDPGGPLHRVAGCREPHVNNLVNLGCPRGCRSWSSTPIHLGPQPGSSWVVDTLEYLGREKC